MSAKLVWFLQSGPHTQQGRNKKIQFNEHPANNDHWRLEVIPGNDTDKVTLNPIRNSVEMSINETRQ